MKLNMQLIKLVIRLLILLILFVMLFIISVFLYSARFWPDVYNYINANITIKRIPTISELNQVVVYKVDYTTEMYSTTDVTDYLDESTVDDFGLNFDDFLNDAVESKRRKRQIPIEEMKVNYKIVKANYDDDFDFEVTTKSVERDLIDESKLTVRTSDVEIMEKKHFHCKNNDIEFIDSSRNISHEKNITEANGIESTYPWIATVFIKNNENNQFEYICDGGLMSNNVVLTAARCVVKSNAIEDVTNILVILGKRSLQATGSNEKVLRVKSVKLHENFTNAEGRVDNDLAIIVLAEPILFNDEIQPVPWKNDEFDPIQSATTGWHVTGRLTPIYFEAGSSKTCKKETEALNTFCATFGDDITTCPSFGGLFVSRRAESEWCLQGITTGNPTSRGVCFNKDVSFTNISNYYEWIIKNVDDNKEN